VSINWQEVITTTFAIAGGGTGLAFSAAWLIRAIFTHKLTKDVERFKSELNAKANSKIEQLRSALQIAAIEHQVRFSNLHEKQAQVIAELYALLVELFEQSRSFVHTSSGGNPSPEHRQEYFKAVLRIREFVLFVDKHRIYLPGEVCILVDKVLDPLKRAVTDVGVYGNIDPTNDPQLTEIGEKFTKAYSAFEIDVPAAQEALAHAFRSILGVGTHAEKRVG
jgi:hypothetical protein